MAIRFHCAACSQPIEVDDEWALKLVACPYCRKTVTAPAETQIEAVAPIPTATAAHDPQEIGSPPGAPPAVSPIIHPRRENSVAVASLVLACVLFSCVASCLVLYRVNAPELQAQQRRATELMQQGKSFMESFRAVVNEQAAVQPSPGLVAASVLQLIAIPVWIATLICGILGVRHAFRRGFAIIALCVVGLAPPVICCGAFLAVS